jgi:hypothetical protein
MNGIDVRAATRGDLDAATALLRAAGLPLDGGRSDEFRTACPASAVMTHARL